MGWRFYRLKPTIATAKEIANHRNRLPKPAFPHVAHIGFSSHTFPDFFLSFPMYFAGATYVHSVFADGRLLIYNWAGF